MKPRKNVMLLDLDGAELEREMARIIKEHPARSRKWTEKEIRILGALYGKVPNTILARQFNRTREAVMKKGASLKMVGE